MNALSQWLADEGVSEARVALYWEALEATAPVRALLQQTSWLNHWKVLEAFQSQGLSEGHLFGSTGYGYGDTSRDVMDAVFARLFRTERGLVRWQLVSGTHAISAGLFGNLLPGQELVSLTGNPYDTLMPVIGPGPGSLAELGIGFRSLALLPDGSVDLAGIADFLRPETSLVFLQRSRGYDWRPSVSVAQLAAIIARVRAVRPEMVILVDNCYGELIETREPTEVGADLVAGSLIKNLGGTLAPTGGYLAGREGPLLRAASRFTSPGIGAEQGPTLGLQRLLAQGLFLTPTILQQALEGAVWAAYVLEREGYPVSPRWDEPRTDLIQAVRLGSPAAQKAFCKGIQSTGPVDHRATPIPNVQPGYRDPILMAGGTFVSGSTLELSADGPEREPFACYLQGGISQAQVQLGVLRALTELDSLR